MDSIDQLAERLKRDSFEVVEQRCYDADPGSSYVFSRMYTDKRWRVAPHLTFIVTQSGWDIDEFNEECNRRWQNK